MKPVTPLPPSVRRIRVRGMVQGVGFRPTVWRLAQRCGIAGEVCNDGAGVLIEAWGADQALDRFVQAIRNEPPPLARIDTMEVDSLPMPGDPPTGFRIAASDAGAVHTAVVPDAATCAQCVADIRDPANRRRGYAFTNCTHCGPRLSIVRGVPYDRARTTMGAFAMCTDCLAEYEDPADRRFHAQPTACPSCGPRLWIEAGAGQLAVGPLPDPLDAARAALRTGAIVAIKGLGGFHLACDARNAEAVERLRVRKRRRSKPLALMARDIDMVRRYCEADPLAQALLASPAAPIVLMPASGPDRVAPQVAPGLDLLGFMLPHAPLHHLLLAGFDGPIVLTSGNLSHDPPCTDNDDARQRLGSIADLFVMHDRGIANRVDDSVVRIVGGQARLLRRARGYAPVPLKLPPGFEHAPELLAMGAELKNTFCLLKDGQAFVSQHIGDLECASAYQDYRATLRLFAALFDHRPVAIAVDRHPDYLSSKLGRDTADGAGIEVEEVQHHHAHVAACLAENGRPLDAAPVLGIVLDGLGWGAEGEIWGGEFLLADYRGFERLARLRPAAMIGGAQAVREPWRNTYAQLRAAIGWPAFERDWNGLDLHRFLSARPGAAIESMLAAGIGCPMASSCGRLFDAVAAAIGVCRARANYEGQAAIELETLARGANHLAGCEAGYPMALSGAGAALPEIDPAPMWRALLADLAAGAAPGVMALRFHRGLAQALLDMVDALVSRRRAGCFDTVALSGGVFQNALLFEAVHDGLRAQGYSVLSHRLVPSNDGGLGLGQVAVAAARVLPRARTQIKELACA